MFLVDCMLQVFSLNFSVQIFNSDSFTSLAPVGAFEAQFNSIFTVFIFGKRYKMVIGFTYNYLL